jgi:type IV pilus assembly protein PilP
MTKRRNNISFSVKGGLLFILLLTVALSGCKKDPPPPPQTTPLPVKTGAAPVKPVQAALSSTRSSAVKSPAPSPVQKQLSTATRLSQPAGVKLDFTGKRDPFKPYAQMPVQQQVRSTRSRTHDPLPIQSFDVEKFKVSGIVTGLKENSALVIDPNGKGYVVKAGMPIGNNDGYVKSVTNSTVEVEESFRDDNGRVRKRLVKLTLLRKK